jgi:diguanylate cyclase (GGDEF)-like protein/PAS domain S-box-containing protein
VLKNSSLPRSPRRTHPSSHRPRPPISLPWLFVFVAVVVYGVLTGLHAGNSTGWTAFADVGEVLAAALATVACAFRARSVRRKYAAAREAGRASQGDGEPEDPERAQRRPAWLLLTFGVGSWTLGQLCVCIYEIGLGTRVPEPSVADGFYLLSYVLVISGLLAFVRTPAGLLSQVRGAVEALSIACGFVLCSWSLLIGSVVARSGSLNLGGLVNLAYPVLDAVALAAVFFVALRRRLNPPAGLNLLAFGIILWTLADSSWWYMIEVDPSLPSVTPFETGWVAGFALVAFAASRIHRPRVWTTRPPDSKFVLALPALPGLGGVLIVLSGWLVRGHVESSNVLLVIMGTFMVLVLVLLVMVTYENHALTSDLERRVDERTAELHQTERYYRALVEHSSDLVMVLDADLKIRYVSDSCERLFGFTQNQLTGRGLEVFGGDAPDALTDALERLGGSSDTSAPVIWKLIDMTGRTRCAESTISNLLADSVVGGFVVNTRDDTDRVALADQLQNQLFHDALTGLANRALLSDRASQAFARSQRTGDAVAIMAIDLDAFKLVNDGFGHSVGDLLLRGVAERLVATVRPEDTVARLGGDVFVVLMDPAHDGAAALALAERIRQALGQGLNVEGTDHPVAASIGVAMGSTPHTNFDQLLSDADVALYCVKRDGRNGVQLFESSMNVNARERFELQTDLRKALDGEGLCLFYQPECNVASGRLDGFEALVRWNHPQRGLMAPDSFIPLAEETGLIVPLGRWVLGEALGQAVRWSRQYASARQLVISVNVSAVQLKAPTILADVEDALRTSQIDPARVVLEVTESSFIEGSAEIIDTLRELKALGVRLAIDDFGTGYTSIGNLRSMPVDILKVDRSFMASSNDGEHGGELLEAIVNIGHVLSLVTIAEGIEETEQLATAMSLGFDLAQGYLLGRPLPPDEAERIITGHSPALV